MSRETSQSVINIPRLALTAGVSLIFVTPLNAVPAERDLTAPSSGSLRVSINCDNDNPGGATKSVPGPAGISAALVVFSGDDANKDSHECRSDYHLKLTPKPASNAEPYMGFMGSDDDWNRHLIGRIDGFSKDGKQVFGYIAETGPHPFQMIFAYKVAVGGADVFDITKSSRRLRSIKCGTAFRVYGTTPSGEAIVEPDTQEPCHAQYRWRVVKGDSPLASLQPGQPSIPLFTGAPP